MALLNHDSGCRCFSIDCSCYLRKIAKINKIKTIGSLGVLLQAKRAGLIPCVAPLLEIIAASPVFISESLIRIVLELANELPDRD